ncbi:glycosyltransferase family 25 protein [Rheinheimera sp.]|uniref:glycosyltransferase family 25 protein n=1 Tax=Rheinheimera sp. TaxID=1869214 RepID=UPI0027B8958B|nr:glycosyltransferase family 25 protein [Rheinheimera sp.]
MKMKVFVINLDQSVERYQHAVAQFAPYPDIVVERISAADGRVMSEQELNQYYSLELNKKLYHKILRPGEKGCYISHIWCWQQIVAQQLDFAIILEDDFILQCDLAALVDAIRQLQQPWHYLKLAMPNKQQPVLQREPMAHGFSLVHYQKMPVSTVAQAVSLAGAQLLLDKMQPFYRPVDVQLQYSFDLGIEVMGVQPLPFRPELEFESLINPHQKQPVNRPLFYKSRLCFSWQNLWHNLRHYGLMAYLTAKK